MEIKTKATVNRLNKTELVYHEILITPETGWLKPIQNWAFETEELAQLAATMWYHFEEQNVDDFRRLFKFTLRAMGYTKTAWAD